MSKAIPKGTSIVRIGPANEFGMRHVRAYRVNLEWDGQKHEVLSSKDDPLFGKEEWSWSADISQNHIVITRSDFVAPSTPDLWFVRMDSSRQLGASMHAVVAFMTDHFRDGTIISDMEFVMLPVHNEDQIGAITWSRETGEVDELYVSPHLRRHNIARRLINAAAAVHQCHGWNGSINANGKRTELGQRLVMSWHNPLRIAPHTELSPPMDHE